MLFVVTITEKTNWFGMCCSAANKCLLKVAHYAAQVEQYEKAINIYEQVNKLT